MLAVSKQSETSRQEHAGFSVIFIQCLPASHVANDGVLKLHSQVGGTVALLQVSALSRHVAVFKQEHPGCPGLSVTFIHTRLGPHASKVGDLKLHSQVGGVVVLLQVSELLKQCNAFRQEQAG